MLVIGCGASGLTAIRQLTAAGHTVECYETFPQLGGVYTNTYDSTILTTSSLLTAFSDYSDGKEADPAFWTYDEYLKYLNGYAIKYGLLEHVNFQTRVKRIWRDEEQQQQRTKHGSGTWRATIQKTCNRAPTEDATVTTEDVDEPDTEIGPFDAVLICAGTNATPCLPHFDGEEEFEGNIIHSATYRKPSEYEGKRVLVVGAGESGSDICNDISKCAAAVGVNVRGKHGHIIPRKQCNGNVTDCNTNRCRYSNPYIMGDWIGWVTQIAKVGLTALSTTTPEVEVTRKIGALNIYQGTSAFSKFGCKNSGFVEAIVNHGASLHRGNLKLRPGGADFDDGSTFDCDVVLACTGFRRSFPFAVEGGHEDIDEYGQTPGLLYKQIFHPAYGGEVAYLGYARPAFGSIPPTAEMQARLFTMVLSGNVELPSCEDMKTSASSDLSNWEMRFGSDAANRGVVDFQIYLDGLARTMKVMPPINKYLLREPQLWLKLMFGPFTVHQYRLVGPDADGRTAREVYARQPLGNFLECSITAFFLITSYLLSMIGFNQFTPN